MSASDCSPSAESTCISNEETAGTLGRFFSIDEIQTLPEWKDDNPLHKDNYARIVGDYHFDNTVKCCARKPNGRLCAKEHKYGFVAQLKDLSCTIIGNCCVNKFDASAKIRIDRNHFRNERRRRERVARLEALLAEKQWRLAQVNELAEELSRLQERVGAVCQQMGTHTVRRLRDMGRTGNAAIVVEAVNYIEYEDEDGSLHRERSSTPAPLGRLRGVTIFSDARRSAVRDRLRRVRQAYLRANELGEAPRVVEVDALVRDIGEGEVAAEELQELLTDERAFLASASLLIFLTGDRAERYKAARVALEQLGLEASRTKAKEWVSEQDSQVRLRFNADKIGFP